MLRPAHLLLAFWAAILPLAASAGAWKRPVDTGFAATSFTLRRSDQGLVSEFGYYRDIGLSARFDLGIDLNQQDSQSGHVMIFTRLPLRQGADTTQIAAEFALGGNHTNLQWHPMYRFTLSAARSKPTRMGTLWGSLDLSVEQRGDAAHPFGKLDASFGVDTSRALSPLLQIETSFGRGAEFTYAITPSLRIKLAGLSLAGSSIFETSDLTIGLEYRRANTQSLGLKIALWQRF